MDEDDEFIDTRKDLPIKQRKFLEVLETEANGRITTASRITGTHRSTFYFWLKDEKFQREVKWIELTIEDEIKAALFQRVLKGSEKATIFFLQKYGGPEWN